MCGTNKEVVVVVVVDPTHPLFSTAFPAYSTWKTLPSGENCDAERSYWKGKSKQYFKDQSSGRNALFVIIESDEKLCHTHTHIANHTHTHTHTHTHIDR